MLYTFMQTFNKDEKLFGKKNITSLFDHGNYFLEHPFRVVWLETNDENRLPARVLIAVSKKNIKKAVMRNRLKRRISEAYRKNKSVFYEFLTQEDKQCKLGLIYISKEELPYNQIEEKILKVIDRLIYDKL